MKAVFDIEVFKPDATVFARIVPDVIYSGGLSRTLQIYVQYLVWQPSSTLYLTANGTRVSATFAFGPVNSLGLSLINVTIPADQILSVGTAQL